MHSSSPRCARTGSNLRPRHDAPCRYIRRVSYDLTGLPPTPEEIDEFLHDRSPQAWEKVVDRLLASPHYGEQWGRHWLDVVRFAESDGYEYDTHRPDAYRYRDYVVQSLNDDKPYDAFVREQLAGDEIDPANATYLVASGFNRLGPLRKNAETQLVASSPERSALRDDQYRGRRIPRRHRGLRALPRSQIRPLPAVRLLPPAGRTSRKPQPGDHRREWPLQQEQEEWRTKAAPIQQEMRKLPGRLRRCAGRREGAGTPEMQIEDLDDRMPAPLSSIYSVKDDPGKVTPIRVLFHGDYLNPVSKVGVRPLGILLPDGTPEAPLDTAKPRLSLANWIADPANPLTARTMVNRIWGYHFGRGIVATPNDFGRMGARPSNPELLDWLANRFVEGGWKLKPVHRMILLSSAYRQSSSSPIEKLGMEKDADDALLWKFAHRRLEAEEIRDSMLAVAGKLNATIGGPSFMVPIDPELVLMLKRPQCGSPPGTSRSTTGTPCT